MNRYRITVNVERLRNVEAHTNPDSGKVEPFTWEVNGNKVTIKPNFVEVARFAGSMDAANFAEAIPDLLLELGKAFDKIRERASMIDMDLR